MKTANLGLCRTLFELSGWGGTEKRWYGSLQFPDNCVAGLIDNFGEQGVCPAYDLGYLLRKLPDYVKLFRNNNGTYYCAAVTDGFRHPDNRLGMPDTAHDWYTANTPEDAACKLAIELFKKGILAPPTNKPKE